MHWIRAFHLEFDRKSMESETATWPEFPNGGKAIAEQIPASEKIIKSKRSVLWETSQGSEQES